MLLFMIYSADHNEILHVSSVTLRAKQHAYVLYNQRLS